MGMLGKLWKKRWILRALFPSIVFNLRKLPFRQACRLPILLYKPRILKCDGEFVINGPVKFGLVRLGVNSVSIFPNSGITLENRGKIVFNGSVEIGNASAISVGKSGVLRFGDGVSVTTSLKLACYDSVDIQDNVLIGWNCLICDTDFHKLKYVDAERVTKGYGKIIVGHDTWIANGCKLYKNTIIPPKCVVGADTILHSSVECEPCSLITSNAEVVIRKTGLYLDREDNKIDYQK